MVSTEKKGGTSNQDVFAGIIVLMADNCDQLEELTVISEEEGDSLGLSFSSLE